MLVIYGTGGWWFLGTGSLRNANNIGTEIGGWYFRGTGEVSEE